MTTTARVQLVVTYFDHRTMYYPCGDGWKVDNAYRCIVVGKFPRTYIPLDAVRSFNVEPITGPAGDDAQPMRTCRKCGRERSVDKLAELDNGEWMCAYGMCPENELNAKQEATR